MAAAFIQPVIEIVRCLYAPIARRIDYARQLSINSEELRDKAKDLSDKRDDINVKIDQLKPQKTATKKCETWKKKVEEIEREMEAINEKLNAPNKCFGGLCPNVFSRLKLGKSVVNMIGQVETHLRKFKSEDEFLTDSSAAKVEKRPEPDSKLTTSAHKMLEEVLNKIRDKSNSKIGIWGMGGVGKTTVLHLLNKSPEISSMFDFVIWVTVSQSWNIRKLQDEIRERLKMDTTNDEFDDTVANKLFQKLEGKKCLLLLDDVWEKVDLSSIGLPNATEDNGCKVVLTTRKWEVCQKMRTDTEINVGHLSEDEARQMFYSNVGDVVERSPTIRQLAEEIVRKCGGLPLALKVVSGALRKMENVNVWNKFLHDLKSPASSFIKDMNDEVFKPLKVSYDQLEEPQKQCFLYCGLYPEDYRIMKSELIYYWRAEGLLSHECSLEDAWIEGDFILQALIDSSLLERCEGMDNFVKLHDVVRDLVLAMTSRKGLEECKHLVRAGFISAKEKMPEDEEWTKATRISFIENELHNLPQSPQCPQLITLLLQLNFGLEEIPESFFINMPKLHVLDLSYTGVKSLPASISNLVNLRALLLRYCNYLEVLPETISLPKGLEMLEITHANISQVPFWISKLTALRCLKLLSQKRMTVPSEVICSLCRMEVFACSKLTDKSEEIVVKELSKLTSISSLEFEFSRVSNLQHFLQSSRSWSTFHFFVDERNSEPQLLQDFFRTTIKDVKKITYVGKEEDNDILPWEIEDLIRRSNYFSLENHGKVNSLSDLGAQNTCNLKHCSVEHCDVLENVIDRNGLEMNAFPNLETLTLDYLSNLRYILYLEPERPLPSPPPSVNIFTNLRKLTLRSCPRIKMVFSSGFMIRLLSNLEDLYIVHCNGFEGMISKDEKDEYEYDDEALPKLKLLSLINLPEFVSFFKDVPMRFPSLKTVWIRNCPKLRSLPFNNIDVNLRADIKIEVQRKWWDELEWDNNTIKLQFQPKFIEY